MKTIMSSFHCEESFRKNEIKQLNLKFGLTTPTVL